MRLESLHPQIDFDRWSRRPGWLQRADPRAKLGAALCLLVGISLAIPSGYPAAGRLAATVLTICVAVALSTRVPVAGVLRRALYVLPFTAVFALVSLLSGDPQRALVITIKALLSAGVAVLLAATTPLEDLLAGLERLRAPPFLLNVILFLYRYLFVIAGQAQRMRWAAEARGSDQAFRVMAGAIAVLFARSHRRAEGLHRAMLARGFHGSFPPLRLLRFGLADFGIIVVSLPAAYLLIWVGSL